MCTVLLTRVDPIAVNKYIISYHIIRKKLEKFGDSLVPLPNSNWAPIKRKKLTLLKVCKYLPVDRAVSTSNISHTFFTNTNDKKTTVVTSAQNYLSLFYSVASV